MNAAAGTDEDTSVATCLGLGASSERPEQPRTRPAPQASSGTLSYSGKEIKCATTTMDSRRHQATSLSNVSEDILLKVGEACSDPLNPKVLCHLAATCRPNLSVLRPKLTELRILRVEVRVLCSKSTNGTTLSSLATTNALDWEGSGLTSSDLAVLGRLLHRGSLPCLEMLELSRNKIDDHGIGALVQGLCNGMLTKLSYFDLACNGISGPGLSSVSESFVRGSMAKLARLRRC